MSKILFRSVPRRLHQKLTFSHNNRCYSFAQAPSNNAEYLKGIFPLLTTPFNGLKDEKISWKHLEKNVSFLNHSQSFAGYVVNGFYGENLHLNFKERSHIVRAVKSIVGRKKTLIVSSSSESSKKMIYTCESMKSCGADYILMHVPHYYMTRIKSTAILEYYTRVADKSPLPIIINNVPGDTLIDLEPDLILDLAHHPNIVGLRESSHNIAKISLICEEIKQNSQDFSVMAGSAAFLLEALRGGVSGAMVALANILGDQLNELYELHIQGKRCGLNSKSKYIEKAEKLQDRLVQPDKIITEMYGVPALKAALDAFGYYGGPCRLPLQELNETELKHVKDLFEQNGFQWHLPETRSIFCNRIAYR